MTDFISCKSPAKLNLFLKIKGKRCDGFHEVETVLEKISLFDDIHIYIKPSQGDRAYSDRIKIGCHGFNVPQDKTNIVYKAAKLFMSSTGIYKEIQIYIYKRIPPGSGMGGASSNAAMVLRALNYLLNTNLTQERLLLMGEELGADVPFFLKDYNFGLGTAKGEKITKINTNLLFWHLIIYPRIKISTSEAYSLFDEKGNSLTKDEVDVKLLTRALEEDKVEKVSERLYNSFEDIIYKKFKYLLKIKNKLLDSNARGALLSGSGANIYGLFFSKKEAIEAEKKLNSSNSFSYFVQGPIRTLAEDRWRKY